jgi:hypothetical protein
VIGAKIVQFAICDVAIELCVFHSFASVKLAAETLITPFVVPPENVLTATDGPPDCGLNTCIVKSNSVNKTQPLKALFSKLDNALVKVTFFNWVQP